MSFYNDNIPLHERALNGGKSFRAITGFSPSGFIDDKHTSIFVKCQIMALWAIIIVFIIVCWVGHDQAKKKMNYRKMNPISKTLESASEGFQKLIY